MKSIKNLCSFQNDHFQVLQLWFRFYFVMNFNKPPQNLTARFVKVLNVVVKDDKNFNRIEVQSELGFWSELFAFNIFSDHPLYNSVKEQDQLYVTVRKH